MDIHLKHTNSFSSGLVKLNNALYKSILPWGLNTTSRWRSLSTTMPQLFQYFQLRNGMTIWVSVQLRKWVVDWHCSKFQFIDQYWHKSLISIGKWIKGGQWLILSDTRFWYIYMMHWSIYVTTGKLNGSIQSKQAIIDCISKSIMCNNKVILTH